VGILDYISGFKWEDTKYPRNRSLVEITGMITERMRAIDSDLKKIFDELAEVKNSYNLVNKNKDGKSLLTRDLNELIYTSKDINPDHYFVEKLGSENLSTVLIVLNRVKEA